MTMERTRKLEGDRQRSPKVGEDRTPGNQRRAAVEPDKVPEPAAVLDHERIVETELVAKLLVLHRIDGLASIVGEDVERYVAGQQPEDQKDREGDDDHRRDDQEKAVYQVALHGWGLRPQLFNDAAPLLMGRQYCAAWCQNGKARRGMSFALDRRRLDSPGRTLLLSRSPAPGWFGGGRCLESRAARTTLTGHIVAAKELSG